jgi:hypothetical protein
MSTTFGPNENSPPPALDCGLGEAGAMKKGHRVEHENHCTELLLNG